MTRTPNQEHAADNPQRHKHQDTIPSKTAPPSDLQLQIVASLSSSPRGLPANPQYDGCGGHRICTHGSCPARMQATKSAQAARC